MNATRQKITLVGLISATYLMVAGGPYGLEDIVQEAGYYGAALFLMVIPFIWSLPTALMVSELSSAIPEEGGFYVWARRALGPFWGFQQAWLALSASIFDMAIYPILFATYFGLVGARVCPAMCDWEAFKGPAGAPLGLGMIVACVLMNLGPPRNVGRFALAMTLAILSGFVVVSVLAVVRHPAAGTVAPHGPVRFDYVTALLFALWNFMGWDNATTFAGEVERPQRSYPLAMAGVVCLVTLTYLIPVLAASRAGIAPESWDTGSWVTVAGAVGGRWLAVAIGLGGMISAAGMFNSLVLSYSRLPVVLAADRYISAVFTRRLRSGAPWVSVVACALAWSLAAQMGLKRVLALDVMLYGLSLMLEFTALVVLRVREPSLERPFRVPGGLRAAIGLAVFPTLLIGLAISDQATRWHPDEGETLAPAWGLILGAAMAATGPLVYLLGRRHARNAAPVASLAPGPSEAPVVLIEPTLGE